MASVNGAVRRHVLRGARAWFLVSRGVTLGARGAILDGEGRVLLVRHTYTPGWQFPGGGVEAGEDALTALGRELAEEAAVSLTGSPALHGIFHSTPVAPRDHVLVYVVREFRLVDRKPDREIAEAAFFRLADLPADTTSGTRRRLEEIVDGRPVSATW